MHVILEYLAIGVLIILFITISLNMIEDVTGRLVTVKEEQLYNVAERLMDKILLTPGFPEDWGTNIMISSDDLRDFGLALNGTRTPYIIDPDKVMRLANLSILPNPLLLNYSRIADLLGISDDYGFRLEMKPMITHVVQPLEWYTPPGNRTSFPTKFKIRVLNWYKIGLPNANVTGIYVIVKIKPGAGNNPNKIEEKKIFAKSNLTDALGETIIDFTDVVPSYLENQPRTNWFLYFLLIHTGWHGFVAVHGYSMTSETDAPVQGYIIGDAIFLSRELNGSGFNPNSGAIIVKDEIVQAVPQYNELLNITSIIWCRSQPNDPEWCQEVASKVLPSNEDRYLVGRIQYIEKLSSHVFVFAQWRGNPICVVINRIPEIDIGERSAQPANSVTVTRIAHIYNYPYIVRLTIWRKVEG